MRFIHAADLHLDSPLSGLRERAGEKASHLADASRRALEKLVAYAVYEHVDFILIAGDIFDGDCADYKSALFLNSQLSKLSKANIPVVIIRGNHDAVTRMSRSLTWPDKVVELPSKKPGNHVIEGLDVVIHGQSFATREVTENIVLDYPDRVPGMFNIGLLHTSLDGRPGHSPYAPCTVQDLRNKNYDYWALGHVHGHAILCKEPYVVFPGNLQGRHANECGPKGFVIVTVDGNVVRSVEPVPIEVVQWARVEVDVSDAPNIAAVCPRVAAALERATQEVGVDCTLAVRIILKGACPAHLALAGDPARLLEECTSVARECGEHIWIEKVVVETTEVLDWAQGEGGAAVAGLLERIRSTPAEADAIISALKPKLDKLPPAIVRAAEFGSMGAEDTARLLAAAEALVLHRLSSGGTAA